MNSIKGFLFSVFLIICLAAKPQAYIPMLDSYAEWHVTTCNVGCITDKYYTIGDTTLKGHTYKFLDLYHYNKNFVIREDTSMRRIYMRILGSATDTSEWLLYDFKINVNDTMQLFNPVSPYVTKAGGFVCDSIKLRPLLTKNHRYFYLHSLDTIKSGFKNTIWVEGIGSLCLINTPGAPPTINGGGKLSCFFNGGVQEYENLDSTTACLSIYPISVNELEQFKRSINLLPNPSRRQIELKSSNFNFDGLDIEIYNILGSLVSKQEYQNFIDISTYTNGLYFARFIIDSKSYSIKFVKE